MKLTSVSPLFSFILQGKCVKKCLEHFKPSYPPTFPDGLADEENDPFHPRPSRPRPSFPPPVVRTVCVIFNNIYIYFLLIGPNKPISLHYNSALNNRVD